MILSPVWDIFGLFFITLPSTLLPLSIIDILHILTDFLISYLLTIVANTIIHWFHIVIRTGNPQVLLGNPYPTRAKPLPVLTGTGFGGFG